MDLVKLLQKGLARHKAGDLEGALTFYDQVLTACPVQPDALYLSGMAARGKNETERALACFRKAVTVSPQNAQYHLALGLALKSRDHGEEAIQAFENAANLDPACYQAHLNLGNCHLEKGATPDVLEKARACYENALQIAPDLAEAHFNLGFLHQIAGRYREAIDRYSRVVELKPGWADAWHNLGNARRQNQEPGLALAAYEKALHAGPASPGVLNAAGLALQDMGQAKEAETRFRQSLAITPDFVPALHNLGNLLKDQARLDEALEMYDRAAVVSPESGQDKATSTSQAGFTVKAALLVPGIASSKEEIFRSRDKLQEHLRNLTRSGLRLNDPYQEVGVANFYPAYHGLNDRPLQEAVSRFYLTVCPELGGSMGRFAPRMPGGSRLRIGFVSRFFRDHTIGRLNLGILRHLPAVDFEKILFCFPGREDEISFGCHNAANQVTVLPDNLEAAARQIAAANLDLLFFPEIGMDPLTYFLAFHRLAPVQVTTWGHPVTTGIPNMDVYLSAAPAEPENAHDHYSEHLKLLSHFVMFCPFPMLPEHRLARLDFDLPPNASLYVCPQSLFKCHPDFDAVIAQILDLDPHGLVLFFQGKHRHWQTLLEKRMKKRLYAKADRVRFLPHLDEADFLAFLRDVTDVVLDTPHFNGGYTSLLAFAAGAPIVTWPGAFMRGRLTYGMYRLMGISDPIAASLEGQGANSYAELAVRLAQDTTARKTVRAGIKAKRSVLFENMETVQELSEVLRSLAEKGDREIE